MVLRSTIFSEDHGSCMSSTFNAVFSMTAREPRDTLIISVKEACESWAEPAARKRGVRKTPRTLRDN